MSQIAYQIEESNHNYRTEIPNIIFELGLKGNEIAVYCVLKKIAGDRGKCFMSVEKISQMAGISENTFREVKIKLSNIFPKINKPLIEIISQKREDGGNLPDLIRIVDIWPDNMSHFFKLYPKEGGDTKNGRGGGAKTEGGGCKKDRGGGSKTIPKEEPIEEEPKKKQQQQTLATSAAVFFDCLKDEDFPIEEKEWLTRNYDEKTNIDAKGYCDTHEIKTTRLQAYKFACSRSLKPKKKILEFVEDNKKLAKTIWPMLKMNPDVLYETLNEYVEIGYKIQEKRDIIKYESRNFKESIIKSLRNFNIQCTKECKNLLI